ncbi:MAG: MAPEG family protein [Pseudomonadota bacterium]
MISIFLPMLIHVGLSLTVLVLLALRRTGEIRAEPSLMDKIALDSSHYSDDVKKLSNNFQNQFQLPVFFHIAGILALLFSVTGPIAGGFAWAFVLSRIAHTVVHTTSNKVQVRFIFFFLGLLSLVGLWIAVALGADESVWFRAAEWTVVETPPTHTAP